MLTTATHDAKRGEDVRARLFALSELHRPWMDHVRTWSRLNRRHLTRDGDRRLPDPGTEYLIYQTLAGSWPLELDDPERLDADLLADYRDRVQAYLVKAGREGKRHTSWTDPDPAYEDAVARFVSRILDPAWGAGFLASFVPFQHRLGPGGAVNGLAQLVARCAAPGVPDTYQGCETWQLSLVDPDNRRPVHFTALNARLQAFRNEFGVDGAGVSPAAARALLADWRGGAVKLFTLWRMLTLRSSLPGPFNQGGYLALRVAGPWEDRVCAFARTDGQDWAIVLLPRLTGAALADAEEESGPRNPATSGESEADRDAGALLLPPEAWRDTRVQLPDTAPRAGYRHLFTGAAVTTVAAAERGEHWIDLEDAFRDFPLAVLTGRTPDTAG